MKTKRKKNLRIIAACSVAIFSLMAVCGGVYSWFTLELSQKTDSGSFAVVNLGTCDLYSIDLYKFNYYVHTYGTSEVIDYFNPEAGNVGKYGFDKTRQQFGYLDDQSEWHQVAMMNTYDPVDLMIFGGTVKDLNCNSVYKFVISTENLTNVKLKSTVNKIIDRLKEDDEIFLTSCTDFDLFFESDLADSNPLLANKVYYPSYIDTSETLTAEEEIYYRTSYLASLKEEHAHLYGSSDLETDLAHDTNVTFDYGTGDIGYLTLYVNVNYAPSELEDTMHLIYERHITAICDFGFKFYFFMEDGE